MKNLIGAFAPTNRFLRSFNFLMLIVLVTIGFASCKDQSKSDVSPETALIAKSDFQDSQSNFDTGGKGTSSDIGQIYVSYNLDDSATGGRGNELGTGGFSDTGGKGDSNTKQYSILDTGGSNGGKSTTGDYTVFDTGGNKGTSTTGGDYFFVQYLALSPDLNDRESKFFCEQ